MHKKRTHSAQKELGVNFLCAPSTFSNNPGWGFRRPDNLSHVQKYSKFERKYFDASMSWDFQILGTHLFTSVIILPEVGEH